MKWWQRIQQRKQNKKASSRERRCRLVVEALEDRIVPAGIDWSRFNILDGHGTRIQTEDQLVRAFAPVLSFHSNEPYRPEDVRIFMNSSLLEDRFSPNAISLNDNSLNSLDDYDVGWYIDLPGKNSAETELFYNAIKYDYRDTVYATVAYDPTQPFPLVAQYWFAYYQSDWAKFGGKNVHEGDWEGVMVFFDHDGPRHMAFAQHVKVPLIFDGGYRMEWNDLDRAAIGSEDRNVHPQVYVALGAHSSYGHAGYSFVDGHYDVHTGGGQQSLPGIHYDVNLLPHSGTTADTSWLDFHGRWGHVDTLVDFWQGDDGPPGPRFLGLIEGFAGNKNRWEKPWSWADGLPHFDLPDVIDKDRHGDDEKTDTPQVPPDGVSDDFPQPIGPDSRRIHISATGDGSIAGSIDWLADRDYFQFIAKRDGVLSVSAISLDDRLDPLLRLYDFTGTAVAPTNDNGGHGKNALITITNAVAGRTYLIEVSGGGHTKGSYRIEVTQTGSTNSDNNTPSRIFRDAPGHTFATAKTVALDSTNKGDDISRIQPNDDVDTYKFVANAIGPVDIEIIPGAGLTTVVTLFDAQKDENNDGKPDGVDSDSSDGADGMSNFRYDVAAGGTYYVRIESKDQASRGEYELHIRPYDADNAPGTSGTDGPPGPLPGWGGVRGVEINLDADGNGSSRWGIDDPGDVRWYQIDGAKKGNMLVTVTPVNDDLKPFITAFRANGGGIDTDTGEFDQQAQVGFTVVEDERIIVAVSSHGSRSTGTFNLKISQPPTLPKDDVNDFGQQPRDLDPHLDDHGNGFFNGKIEPADDNDWFIAPLDGKGYVTIEVTADESPLTPFLELNRNGNTDGFFDTDDGRDGRAKITFLPSSETAQGNVWIKVSGLDGSLGAYSLRMWRSASIHDDHPDSGGQFTVPHELAKGAIISIAGTTEHPGDNDAFRVEPVEPGPVAILVVSHTEGFKPFMEMSWEPPNSKGETQDKNGGAGARNRTFHVIDSDVTHVNIDVKYDEGNGIAAFGDYTLYVWQPGSKDDFDPDTVGPEASPLRVDGTGNGSLPGYPNGNEETPALNFAGDKDVFQIRTASDRPITFTIESSVVTGGTFLRIYDATGHAIATDHNSGPNGESQITLEAFRGDLFYAEVSAFDGNALGEYRIRVSQPTDDHADVPVLRDLSGTPIVDGPVKVTKTVTNPNNGHVYHLLKAADGVSGITWTEAEAAAVTLGGHLATVNDADENAWIASAFDDPYLWLGLNDAEEEGTFVWSSGEPVTYTNWWPGEPSNTGGNEDYVQMFNFDGGNYQWNDLTDSNNILGASVFGLVETHPLPTRILLNNEGYGETTGIIESFLVGDRDVFQTTATERGQMTVTVETTDDKLDTFLRVYDSRGNLVAIDDDGGDGRNSSVTFNTFQDETYFIEVSGYGDNSVGAYKVTVQTLPHPRESFIGMYDIFEDAKVDDLKWRTANVGNSLIEESRGVIRLSAQGHGAGQDDNSAMLTSRATVDGDIEFDFTAHVPTGDATKNGNKIELTDGTNSIRLEMVPNGNGKILLKAAAVGYSLDTAGTDVVVEQGSSHHAAIEVSESHIVVFVNDKHLGTFDGPLQPDSALKAAVQVERRTPYDDFDDNSIDSTKWIIAQDPNGQGIAETNQQLVLYATADSNSRTQTADATMAGVQMPIYGARFTLSYLDGSRDHMVHYAEIRSGEDAIRIFLNSGGPLFQLQLFGKYGSGTVATWSARTGSVDIREEGGDIVVRFDGEEKYRIAGKKITDNTKFHAHARHFGDNGDGYGDKRMAVDDLHFYQSPPAELILDNIKGQFLLPPDPVIKSFDVFDDNSINFDQWHIAGTVEENSKRLFLSLFRDRQPVHGYASTAGIEGGTNIRGFKLKFNRTSEPKNLKDWDLTTNLELTNGADWIRISRLHQQTFLMQSGGAYGIHNKEISVSSGEIPDGPFEIRERDGNIEVLHNNIVKLSIADQTVRAGSYFVFQTHGNPLGQSTSNEPETFDASIDDLQFYVDPEPYTERSTPSLKKEDDTGSSDADHITNKTTLQWQWDVGPDGSMYQWREGELQADGSIDWTAKWSKPQTENAATVELNRTSAHIFSVRSISPEGIVGEATSRGFVVDQQVPPTPSQPALAPESDPDQDGVSHDFTPVFTGTAEPGSIIQLVADNTVVGSGVADGLGNWRVQTEQTISFGTHTVRARATDIAGNFSPLSEEITFTVTIGDQIMSYKQDKLQVPLPPGGTYNVAWAGSTAWFWDRDLQLQFDAGGDYHNIYGGGERWLVGVVNQFGNRWYFLKPNGELWAWSGTGAQLTGQHLTTLAPLYYSYADLLVHPSHQHLAYALDQYFGLTHTGNLHQDYGGFDERWLLGNGNRWYFITPDGQLFAWDGTLDKAYGTLVATLDSVYYAEIERLYNAQPNLINVQLQDNQLVIDPAADFIGQVVIEVTGTQGTETISDRFTVFAKNHAPELAAIGDQTIPPNQDTKDITLTASDPDGESLTFSVFAAHEGYLLAHKYKLHFAGSFFENYGGENERWLRGVGGQWHFIKPNGNLYLWDNTPGRATGTLLHTMDQIYYYQPELLYDATQGHLAYALDRYLDLRFTGNDYENYGGENERWLLGNYNQWYFIKPNGEFYRWDGTPNQASGTLLTTLDPIYYDDIARLHNAQPDQFAVSLQNETLTIDPRADFLGTFWIWVRVMDDSKYDDEILQVKVVEQ